MIIYYSKARLGKDIIELYNMNVLYSFYSLFYKILFFAEEDAKFQIRVEKTKFNISQTFDGKCHLLSPDLRIPYSHLQLNNNVALFTKAKFNIDILGDITKVYNIEIMFPQNSFAESTVIIPLSV